MLHLTVHGDRFGARAWKGMNWDLLDALDEAGWISDPKTKAKSVALTDEGERLAAEFFGNISEFIEAPAAGTVVLV